MKELRLRNWADPPVDPGSINSAILTHAHIDHTGYLPRFVAQGFNGPVRATTATVDLARILLPDAAHLQEEEARFRNKHVQPPKVAAGAVQKNNLDEIFFLTF